MCNKSIICGVLFASGAITFYIGTIIRYSRLLMTKMFRYFYTKSSIIQMIYKRNVLDILKYHCSVTKGKGLKNIVYPVLVYKSNIFAYVTVM
jgi:hypothetical protein